MKQNNKGFTLIELLAVIVILAIIALIATPIILNMINDAKKSAAKDSAYGYIDAVDKYIALAQLGTEISTEYDVKKIPASGTVCSKSGDAWTGDKCADFVAAVKVKGSQPDNGSSFTIANGAVSSATLVFNGFEVTYANNNVTNVTDAS